MDDMHNHDADGIFRDENVVNFYIHVKQLVNDCFVTLHQLTSEKAESVCEGTRDASGLDRTKQRAFKLGLEYILNSWDDKIKDEEFNSAMQRFPGIDEDYTYCIRRYCDSIQKGGLIRGHSSFSGFLYTYVCGVASAPDMENMKYFTDFNFADKDSFLKELFRRTLLACVHFKQATGTCVSTVATTTTHLSRTAEAAARSACRIMDHHPHTTTATTMSEPVTDTHTLASFRGACSVMARSIAPFDSVSNAPSLHQPPSTHPHKPHKTMLTRSRLDNHDRRLSGHKDGSVLRLGPPLDMGNIKNITLCSQIA
jgi:hypothetical protein